MGTEGEGRGGQIERVALTCTDDHVENSRRLLSSAGNSAPRSGVASRGGMRAWEGGPRREGIHVLL